MNKLTINVQADRLPNIDADDGTGNVVPCAHITLKVSAVVTGSDAIPANVTDELLPWTWRSAANTGNFWDAHDPAAWTLWSVDPATKVFTKLEPASVKFFRSATVPPDFDHDASDADVDKRFEERVAQEIKSIVDSNGPDAALRRPAEDVPTTSRTVFGFVESLSGLPFPIPAATKTVTAIRFAPLPDDAHLIVAAPNFASSSGVAYELDLATLKAPGDVLTDGVTIEFKKATGAVFEAANVEMRASLPAKDLAPAMRDDQRLLDLAEMIIRIPDGHAGVEAADWVAALPRRIGEAVDPYARLLAVFDDTITQALAEDDATAKTAGKVKGPLREALEADLTPPPPPQLPPYRLLKATDQIAWSVIGLRIVGSTTAPPQAPMLLQAIADRKPLLASAVAERLAVAAAATGEALDRSSRFVAFAATRLARLVGMSIDALPGEVAASDRPEGFMATVVKHWTGASDVPPVTVSTGAANSYRLGARRAIVRKDASAWPTPGSTALALEPEPLFDVTRLPRGRTAAWRFTLRSIPATAFALEVGLVPAATAAITKVEGQPDPGGMKLTLTLPGGNAPAELVVAAAKDVVLTLEFEVPSAGKNRLVAQLASEAATTARIHTEDVALERTPFYYLLTASGADLSLGFPVIEASTALADELRRMTSPEALRAGLALAHAGPYLDGIVAGRTTWNDAAAFAPGTLGERIHASIKALTTIGGADVSLYTRLLDAALAGAGLPPRGAGGTGPQVLLRDLLVRLMTDAAAAAAILARNLVPATADGSTGGGIADQARRLTPDATPLVMRIDQVQSFDATVDLWARIAGIGVLVARTADAATAPTEWHSLNVARLHVPEYGAKGVRPELGPHNAVRVAKGSLDERGALIDPAAQQVAEVSGVRSALVSYDNRSLVATMSDDQSLSVPDGVPAIARRIEVYGAPPKASLVRLPALSFGHVFHLAPYVIGQGGALPPWLRADATQPFERNEKPGDIKPPAAAIRRAIYRRTRGVGMPVLLPPRVLPGVPEGVAPLAGEIAIRPPPMSIGQAVQGRFFVSEDGTAGVIDPVPAGDGERSGLRIELGDVTVGAPGPLKITLHGRPETGEDPEPLAELVIPALVTHSRLRVDVFSDGWRYYTAMDEHAAYVEDEPAFSAETMIADPNLGNLDKWRAVAIYVVAETTTVSFEAPLVTFLVKTGTAEPETLGRPRIAPESSHTQRSLHVLDGIKRRGKIEAGREKLALRFRRPTVDYGTYERWLNAALIEGLGGAAHVDIALVAAKRLTGDEDAKAGEARSLDDPAVTAIFVELVRIFPNFKSLALLQAGAAFDTIKLLTSFESKDKLATGLDRLVRVETQMQAGATDELAVDGSALVARLLPGRSYELRVYGGVPATQALISKINPTKRLSQAVRGVMRTHGAPGPSEILLGAPLVLTFEVATEAMPEEVFQGDAGGASRFAILRPPTAAAEVAHVGLEPAFAEKQHQRLRYCGNVGLIPQRWSWRGRPQDDDWSRPEHEDRFDIAFSDRRVDDIGMILTRRLERAHVYNGRRRLNDPFPALIHKPVIGPPLFEKDLDWRAGVALWRFGMRFESRYAPMRPGDAEFVRFTHRAEGKAPAWKNVAVRDRATGRAPKRPGFALALPLTEPMMASGAVPPLLLLFDEGFHANFHAGDGIEVAIEVARHPFTERERTAARAADVAALVKKLPKEIGAVPPPEDIEEKKDELERAKVELAALQNKIDALTKEPLNTANLKYWPEYGPDPIRSGMGSEGELLPIRVDGPIGYTFDAGTEAGRFDHTGFLVSPVWPRAWPWSLVKLRCRRLEAPEGLDPDFVLTPGGTDAFNKEMLEDFGLLPPKPILITDHPNWRVANNVALLAGYPATPPGEAVFATEHEGLVIDLAQLQGISSEGFFTFDFADEPDPKLDKEVTVTVTPNAGDLIISLATALGPAGVHKVSVSADQTAQLRLVLSLRDKPQEGDKYRPAGDISVRLRIAASDGMVREGTDRWLAIASAPFVGSHLNTDWLAINDPVLVKITASGAAAKATVRPARLSGFTPSVWCQFAELMSVFHASVADGGGVKSGQSLVAHTDLMATLGKKSDATKLTLAFRPGAQDGHFDKMKLAGLHPLDALARGTGEIDTAQVEEVLAVLVTRYVRDVFDRIRERPVAVKTLGEPQTTGLVIDLAQPDWPKKTLKAADIGSAGRVRFLRLLRPKLRQDGGFLAEAPKFPQDYFDPKMLEARLEMNPADAKGIMLGMSMPVEWQQG